MDVGNWLRELDLEQYVAAFRENAVTSDVLPDLTPQDLKDLGVAAVGHRRRLLQAIAALRNDSSNEAASPTVGDIRPLETRAERRQLSVMFCDLMGSTELSARLDPEDLATMIRAYQLRVRDTVSRFGGFIARYVGDGVLVYFGWPEAREAEAEWAVQSALAIIAAIGGSPIGGKTLRVRIGIATGLVVVGEPIGMGDARQQTAIGETPNRAARLQGLAEPDGVVIDAATRQQVGGLFECRDLGAVQLKGLPEPVQAWNVQGESALANRFEALRSAKLTPLIGREEELDMLLRRWRLAADGDARVVLIAGEPGIGKSRLLAALEERLQGEDCARLRYFCSPHHQQSPLHPILEHLKNAAGFTRSDTVPDRIGKLRLLLADSFSSEEISLLADLLSVPTDDESWSIHALSPQRRKELVFDALTRQLGVLAGERPVLMLVEDLHWADPSTRELFDLTIERLAGHSILLVMTFRPEFQAPWIGRADISMMTLNRLGRKDAAFMVALVATRTIPPELIERIAERTDGVPLFVEELTRVIIEAGLKPAEQTAQLPVPATLQASLIARLDRLPVGKTVAQIGSVIGRSFSFELLAVVADLPGSLLREGLAQLVASGLALERGVPPDASYVFKHALVQDAAYESLLRSRRAELHGQVVNAILRQNPDAAETQSDLLAYHCAAAGWIEQAIDYWLQAGQAALAHSANIEAIAMLKNGLQSLDQLANSRLRQSKEIDLQIALGGALQMMKGQASYEAGDAFGEALRLSRLSECLRFEEAAWGLWMSNNNRGRLEASVEDAAGMLHYGQSADNVSAKLLGHRCMALSMMFQGKLSSARQHFADTHALRLDLPRRLINQRLLYPWGASAAHTISAWVSLLQGHFDQAFAEQHEVLSYAEKSSNPHGLALTLHQSCLFYQLLADINKVEQLSAELVALTAEQGFVHWHATGTIFHGWCVATSGELEAGLAEMHRGLATKQATGAQLKVPYYLGLIAALTGKTAAGDAEGLFADALERVDRTGERWFEAELHRLKGDAILSGSNSSFVEAEAEYQRSLSIAREQGAKFWELRAATSLAHLWCDQRRHEDAKHLLVPIYAWFTDGHEIPDMERACVLLSTLT